MSLLKRWLAKRPWQVCYGASAVFIVGVFLSQQFILQFNLAGNLLLFLPAIVFSRWYGGPCLGLCATVLSGFLTALAWLQLSNVVLISLPGDLIQVGLFMMMGVYISTLNARSQLADTLIFSIAQTDQASSDPPNVPQDNSWYSRTQLMDIKNALDQAAIVAITDAQGVIQYVNDRFCQISQYQSEELIGKPHWVINSDFHPKEFFQNLWSTIDQGQVWQGEIQNRAKDGSLYWVDTTVVPMLNQQGQIQHYLAIQFEVTQRKQAELELQRLNDQLESLVEERTARLQQYLSFEATLKRITDKVRDSLDEAQILQTAVGELAEGLGANSCHAALYDVKKGTSTIRYEFNPSIFSTQGQVTDLREESEIHNLLLQGEYLQFCNLERHPIRGRVTMLACPMLDEREVVGSLWLVIDKEYAFQELEIRLVQQVANQCAIALRQAQLYENAQAQVKVLEEVNWLKDDFLSTVSHELRTPVSNMRMSIHMLELVLQRDQSEFSSRQKANQYLQILKQECEREISLINDLLDLQRLEAGQRSQSLETVEVEPWLTRLLQPFENRVRERQLQLQLYFAESLPPLMTDLPALERILSELMNNACKYTPPGRDIQIHVNATPGTMQFVVQNSGVEIAPEELPRIFDKFYRVPNADPWKQGGTGLGLALVQRLVDHLNGAIAVSSTAEQTEFCLDIANLS
jgi:PAS domain S-box-containing protein